VTKKAKPKPDWTQIRIAYVHGTGTLEQLAVESRVTLSAIKQRSSRENWSKLRQDAAAAVSKAASTFLEAERTKELSSFNTQDLRIAKALRARVAKAINDATSDANNVLPAKDLRSLASAAEAAQRIGRLALGATTENSGLSAPDGGPILATNIPLDEYEAALRRVLQAVA
jgi:hypothetical protein